MKTDRSDRIDRSDQTDRIDRIDRPRRDERTGPGRPDVLDRVDAPARTVHTVHTVLDSPVGPLTLVAVDGVLSGLYMTDQRHRPPQENFGPADPEPFGAVIAQLGEYFAGERRSFDLPLNLVGTDFQRTVWKGLLTIPYGQTLSYGELAERIGRPSAARAVGLANGRNPIGIIVPCHRVIGSGGSLTGYGGGLDRKRRLLDFERHGVEQPALL